MNGTAVFIDRLRGSERRLAERDAIGSARDQLAGADSEHFRHHMGGTYKVLGLMLDATGVVHVRYKQIPSVFGKWPEDIERTMPFYEWMDDIILDEADPANPNCLDKDAPFRVKRFVPVFKIDRYETRAQIDERSAK